MRQGILIVTNAEHYNMKKNNIIVVILLIIFIFSWGYAWRLLLRSQKVKGMSTDVSPTQLISLSNLERTKANLPTLNPNQQLTNAAQAKAQDMFNQGYFDHLDPNQNGSWLFIEQADYNYRHAGENLARNFKTSQAVIDAWMNSPSHKQNLLSTDYTDIGVAVVESQGEVYVVQILASPLPQTATGNNSGENFSFSSPISGQKSLTSSNFSVPFFSLAMAIFMMVVGFYVLKSFQLHFIKYQKPDISHWKKS